MAGGSEFALNSSMDRRLAKKRRELDGIAAAVDPAPGEDGGEDEEGQDESRMTKSAGAPASAEFLEQVFQGSGCIGRVGLHLFFNLRPGGRDARGKAELRIEDGGWGSER